MPANHSTSMLQRFHRLNEFYTSLLYSVALMLEWVKDGERKKLLQCIDRCKAHMQKADTWRCQVGEFYILGLTKEGIPGSIAMVGY